MNNSTEVLKFTASYDAGIIYSKRFYMNTKLSKIRDEISEIIRNYLKDDDECVNIANELINNINIKGYTFGYSNIAKLSLHKETYEFKKYELTDEVITIKYLTDNIVLYRIKALVDIPKYNIKKGDLGGYVETIFNLSQNDECWINEDAKVFDNAFVSGDAYVSGKAKVYNNANIYDCASVDGGSCVCGDAEVYENAIITDNAEVYDNCKVFGNAKLMGCSEITESANVFGNAELYQYSYVEGCACIYGNAKLDGNCTIKGNAKVYGNARITNDEVIGQNEEIFEDNNQKENRFTWKVNLLHKVSKSKEKIFETDMTFNDEEVAYDSMKKRCMNDIANDKRNPNRIDFNSDSIECIYDEDSIIYEICLIK